MKRKHLQRLFDLSAKLYKQEAKKREPMPTPYAWARNDETGELIVYVPFKRDSDEVMCLLENYWSGLTVKKASSSNSTGGRHV